MIRTTQFELCKCDHMYNPENPTVKPVSNQKVATTNTDNGTDHDSPSICKQLLQHSKDSRAIPIDYLPWIIAGVTTILWISNRK